MNLFKKRPAPNAGDPIVQLAAEARREAKDARAALKAFSERVSAAHLPSGTWIRSSVEIGYFTVCLDRRGLWLSTSDEHRRPWRWVSDVTALTAAQAIPELERKLREHFDA
jgi:hypothetical protein